jgi:methionyl-tRNA synthetase
MGQEDQLSEIESKLPSFEKQISNNGASILGFNVLKDREKACEILSENNIRFRTGKTLVPFRLTGNIEWGLNAPEIEDLKDLTFWVWPESLWAPISFTAAYLEQQGLSYKSWKEWWCSKDAQIFQFIGEDNIFFYTLAELSMFMGTNNDAGQAEPPEGSLQLPNIIANKHILYFDKKASSSSELKPPMAKDLLQYYTSDQLRAHFLALGLSLRNVGFKPKFLNPDAGKNESDPVLNEGNLLSNVLNKAVRSCFYTLQKHYNNIIPFGKITPEIKEDSDKVILDYEIIMSKCEFHSMMALLNSYIRNINKYWSRNMNTANEKDDKELQSQTLIDTLHMVRTAIILMHPVAPEGTEKVLEYLNLENTFWSWDNIFETIYFFMDNTEHHEVKNIPPRFDFFEKHMSQINY